MKSVSISKKILLLFLVSVFPQLHAATNDCYTENSCSNCAVSADLLFWFPSEEVATVWADVVDLSGNQRSWEALVFDFTWDYGLRLGVGYNLAHDHWDSVVYWTWFRTSAKHTISPKPNASISPEFFAAFLSGDTPRSMSASWSLLLNMFDWELGRCFCLSENVSLRPFLGIKGGWINQSIRAQYFDLIIDLIFPTNHSASEQLKNNFWGVGPLGGINSKWRVGHCGSNSFEFFGDFSAATMWGTWTCDDVYKNTLPKTSTVSTQKSPLGALMFRGFVGIGWDVDIYADRSHFSAKLGYEMQLWVNQLRIATFQLQRLHHDLTLQGITLHCRFDF